MSGPSRLPPGSTGLRSRLRRFVGAHGLDASSARFLLLVPVVGLATGMAAVIIMKSIEFLERCVWQPGSIADAAAETWHSLSAGGHAEFDLLAALDAAPILLRILAPTLGGLVVGGIIYFGRLPERGQGTGSVIEAIALRGALVSSRPALFTQLAGMVTVGSGGSLGREGPLMHTGATLASSLGRRLGLDTHHLRIIVGCGLAAGMAAAYNAPIGGAVFAMEVVLGNFALDIFGPIVIASVLATSVSRIFLTGEPIFAAADYGLRGGWELPLFALLGVIAGVLAVLFIQGVRLGETIFTRIRLPAPLKPALGFAVVGLIGVFTPHVYGNGADTIRQLALGDSTDFNLGFLLLFPFVKLAATSITAGSGGRGGLFTPSLFVGALIGAGFGHIAEALAPGMIAKSGAYALVGMGAIAAGTTHAPLTAILVVFEMTGNYDLILPLMAACIIANFVSRSLRKDSIYLAPLSRRGVKLPTALEELVMEQTTAKDLLRTDDSVLRDTTTFPEIFETFLTTRRTHLFVTDDADRLLGAVSLHDMKHVLKQGPELTFVLAVDIARGDFPVVFPEDRLTTVLERMAEHQFERLPVIKGDEDRCYLGFVMKRDVIAIYNQEVLGRPALLAKFSYGHDETYVELPPHHRVALVVPPPEMIGRSLAKLRLPAHYEAYVLAIKRRNDDGEDQRLSPRPHTVLQPGDRLIMVGPEDQLARLTDSSGS